MVTSANRNLVNVCNVGQNGSSGTGDGSDAVSIDNNGGSAIGGRGGDAVSIDNNGGSAIGGRGSDGGIVNCNTIESTAKGQNGSSGTGDGSAIGGRGGGLSLFSLNSNTFLYTFYL
jgi:hypothetical protein